jgi:hypothetical protein
MSFRKWALSLGGALVSCANALSPIQPAYAQSAGSTQPKSQAVLCGQTVNFSVAPNAEVPAEFRKYVGIWSGTQRGTNSGYNQDYEHCVAYVVERITADGTVYSIRVWGNTVRLFGTGNSFAIKPGTAAWRGKVAGESLRLEGRGYLQELRLSGPNAMEGGYSDPQGAAVVRLKRQQQL